METYHPLHLNSFPSLAVAGPGQRACEGAWAEALPPSTLPLERVCFKPECKCVMGRKMELLLRPMLWIKYPAVFGEGTILCDPAKIVACQAPLSMGILQARILEWVAMPCSRVSSQSRPGHRALARSSLLRDWFPCRGNPACGGLLGVA